MLPRIVNDLAQTLAALHTSPHCGPKGYATASFQKARRGTGAPRIILLQIVSIFERLIAVSPLYST
jgi:hypothetical protein